MRDFRHLLGLSESLLIRSVLVAMLVMPTRSKQVILARQTCRQACTHAFIWFSALFCHEEIADLKTSRDVKTSSELHGLSILTQA